MPLKTCLVWISVLLVLLSVDYQRCLQYQVRDGAIKDLFDQDLIRVTIHVKYAATLSLLLGLPVVFSSLEQGSKNGETDGNMRAVRNS